MRKRFADHIATLIPQDGRTMLAAVSGGVDSMVLLKLLHDCGYRVAAAHCNFSLRGEESDGDAALAGSYARSLGVPFHTITFDTEKEAAENGESIQMAARRLRYAWFERLADEKGYAWIAVAHHADDAIETPFVNLTRGTGLRGLCGIAPVQGRIVRPLLPFYRREIAAYAAKEGIPFREDSSNLTDKYLRNKIRHAVIPALEEMAPGFREIMTENIGRLKEASDFIDAVTDQISEQAMHRRHGESEISLSILSGTGLPPGFLLYELLRPYGFNRTTTDAIGEAYAAGACGKAFRTLSHEALLDRGTLRLRPAAAKTCPEEVSIGDFSQPIRWGDLLFTGEEIPVPPNLRTPPDTILIDRGKIAFPLTLRAWKEGDRFRPLGMQGEQKVSDLLTDRKLSRFGKARQPILLSADGRIVWVAGIRADDRFKIDENTQNCIRIKQTHYE